MAEKTFNEVDETKEERIEKISNRITELTADKDEIEEAIKNHRATLAEILEEGTTRTDSFEVSKRSNLRFDDSLARKNLTPKQYDDISVQKADSKKAAALLDEETLAKCKRNYGDVVTVKMRRD